MPRANAKLSAPQHRRRFGPGRSILRQAARDRGLSQNNLWYHYSARLDRDVVLKSDVEFDHFCWVEADPRVLRYELEPASVAVVIDQKVVRTRFDAFVEFRAGPPEVREIKCSEDALVESERQQRAAQTVAAADAGFRYVRITKADLAKHLRLIHNWRYALAHQAACRGLNLKAQESELIDLVRRKDRFTLEELLVGTDPALRLRYLAALFNCLQTARLCSDLDTNSLCAASQIWMPEVGHGH
jgi:hypothetical protein